MQYAPATPLARRFAAAPLFAFGLLCSAPAAAAGSNELEHAYWLCDHAAATTLLDAGTAAHCSIVHERLLKTRFGGSFDALLAWWREHRVAQHQAIAKSAVASSR